MWPDQHGRYIARSQIPGNELRKGPDDITFVTHLSRDRALYLARLCSMWDGPISASILLKEGAEPLAVQDITALEGGSTCGGRLTLTAVQAGKWHYYQPNKMRNVALGEVRTTYAFVVDVDFVPSSDLRHRFLRSLSAGYWPMEHKVAIVVPAFDYNEKGLVSRSSVPREKKQLRDLFKQKLVDNFERQQYPSGHYPTDSDRWFDPVQTKPYEVSYGYGYEPYLITKRPFVAFDERFVGYGQNKVSRVFEMAIMRYRFFVHSDIFLFHKDLPGTHPKETARDRAAQANEAAGLRKDWTVGWSCWHNFLVDLEKHYGTVNMDYICKEPFWVSEYIYPRLHSERGLSCYVDDGIHT